MGGLVYALCENKGADRPARPRRLISVFVVRCQDSIIPPFFPKISRLLTNLCSGAGWFRFYLVAGPRADFLVAWLIMPFVHV